MSKMNARPSTGFSNFHDRTSYPNTRWTPSITIRTISTATEPITNPIEADTTLHDPMRTPKVSRRPASTTSSSSSSLDPPNITPPFPLPGTTQETPDATIQPFHGLREHPTIVARVTKAGYHPTIVQVTRNIPRYSPHLRKYFKFDDRCHVYDPNSALVEGDVIEFHRFSDDEYRARVAAGKGRSVKHVVERILSPFGTGVAEREKQAESTKEERMMRLDRTFKRLVWESRIQEEREKEDAGEVVERMVKDGKNRKQKVIAERLEAADQVQKVLDKKGVGKAEVKRRVKQAGIGSGFRTGRAQKK